MLRHTVIKKKINDLINLMLTDGVQPSDLADNIFFESYVQIRYEKINGEIIGELVFKEKTEDKELETTLRYFYGINKKIIRIEEEISDLKRIIWDRDYEEARMINDIVSMMMDCYLPDQIEKFTNTLPEDLRLKLEYAFYKKNVS